MEKRDNTGHPPWHLSFFRVEYLQLLLLLNPPFSAVRTPRAPSSAYLFTHPTPRMDHQLLGGCEATVNCSSDRSSSRISSTLNGQARYFRTGYRKYTFSFATCSFATQRSQVQEAAPLKLSRGCRTPHATHIGRHATHTSVPSGPLVLVKCSAGRRRVQRWHRSRRCFFDTAHTRLSHIGMGETTPIQRS